jgi:hypothetical protein
MLMNWILSPLGIAVTAVFIVVIASLIYWKREPIKKWLRGWRMHEVELGAGPAKAKWRKKEGAESASSPSGVDFGEGGDFRDARIRAAGRDIRRGSAAAESPGGKAPGVDFGKEGKFRKAEVEAAGRDIVEDTEEEEN